MPNASFVNFLSNYEAVPSSRKYDGYLSFIPPTSTDKDTPHHRRFHNPDFFWLEMKDSFNVSHFSLEIDTPENCLWIYIDLIGRHSIQLLPPTTLTSGSVLCYIPNLNPYPITLGDGKNWFLLIGISKRHFESLAIEYPLLQNLPERSHNMTKSHIIGQMSLHSKLLSTLEALKRIEFRPFSATYLMAHWNLRLFHIVFQETKEIKAVEEDNSISLYYKSLNYIREHYWDEDISVQKVAGAMLVSVRKLSRSFENRPYTVNSYILELKLAAAREQLLQSDSTVVSISFGLHFADAKRFSKLFKKRYQFSPSEFRERMQQKELFKRKK